MLISGLQKTTLLDYPGKVAATIFTAGCNFNCHFCHNPELVKPELIKNLDLIPEKKVLDFLEKRKKLLDGVCLTGGEPLLQIDLEAFIKKIKDLGLLVKLDTNGTNPKFLKKLIKEKLIDFVAMDIKASWDNYKKITNRNVNLTDLRKSVKIILDSGLDHEFRTTVLSKFHSIEDLRKIVQQVKGAKVFAIQKFRANSKLLNPEFVKEKTFLHKELLEIKKELESLGLVDKVVLR